MAEKLLPRGYWRVEIRPTDFLEDRVASPRLLQSVIEKARVQLRGWDFPHLSSTWDLPESQSWVGVETDWSTHVEVWRAYRSGQFVFRGGVWTDWVDQHHFPSAGDGWSPGTGFPIVSSLWSVTEFWEFAARYSQTEAGAESMFVEVAFHGLKGRVLFGDSSERSWPRQYGPAKMESFTFTRTVSRTDLISNAAKLANVCAAELFAAFGWEASVDVLESIQAELFSLRRRG